MRLTKTQMQQYRDNALLGTPPGIGKVVSLPYDESRYLTGHAGAIRLTVGGVTVLIQHDDALLLGKSIIDAANGQLSREPKQ